jgi:hypothetical protein
MLLLGWGWTRVNQAEQSKYNSIISDVQSSGLLPSSFRPETFIGYTTAGEWGDYMYAEYGIISSTLEIYGKAKIDLLVQIDQNDTHTKYERKFTDFEQFNPPIDEFEVLHSGLLKFEKYWFKLTPQINLVGIDKRKISNGTYELTLHLCSGSKYWNTTDNPQINVISSNDEIIESYPNEIPTLYPSNPQELKIVLKSNLPDNFSLDINITSDWAADLSLHIQVRPEEFKAVTGFSYLIIVSVFLLFVPVIKKNK